MESKLTAKKKWKLNLPTKTTLHTLKSKLENKKFKSKDPVSKSNPHDLGLFSENLKYVS